MNMKKVLLSLVMIITVLCLAVNIAYADDVASTSESIPTNVIDLGGNTKDTLDIGTTTTTTTTTQSTIDLGTTTTTTTQATTNTVKTTASTVTTLPHTGATETSGVLVTIALLAVVGLVSFKVIKNNSDIK